MDNAIVPAENSELVKFDDSAFESVAKSGDYLPRVQLMTARSAECSAENDPFPINHYALIVDNSFNDLGTEVDALVISWRPKALEIGETLIVNYDQESDTFVDIRDRSADSNSGCMYGPEFLLWVPKVKQFVTLFMCNNSARRESRKILARMHKAITLGSKMAKNARYQWRAITCVPCSDPFDVPEMPIIQVEADKFNNPQSTNVEVADESETRVR